MGADEVIDIEATDFVLGTKPVNLVIDTVGGETQRRRSTRAGALLHCGRAAPGTERAWRAVRAWRAPGEHSIAILEELRTLTRRYELLFPGVRSPSRPLSENTLNAALRRLGYAKENMSSNGFRAAASSLLNESGKWNADAIEAQLAHVEANAVRKAYARAEYWAERVEMMVYWADRLDELRRGGIVMPLRA